MGSLELEDGSFLGVGDLFEVDGLRGRFVVKRIREGEVDAYGGTVGREMSRAFFVSRVKVRRGRKVVRVKSSEHPENLLDPE